MLLGAGKLPDSMDAGERINGPINDKLAGGEGIELAGGLATDFCVASSYCRYDTIRDAILTCARKPTRVGLIHRTEPTSKNCKTDKLKSKNSLC